MSTPNAIPTLYIMTGTSGSGKSYVRNTLPMLRDLPVLDCDIFKSLHPEYNPKDIKQHVHDWSKSQVKRAIINALNTSKSFVYDSTGASVNALADLIARAISQGYLVGLVHVECSLETCLARNKARRRVVPEHIVRRIHTQVRENLFVLMSLVDFYVKIQND